MSNDIKFRHKPQRDDIEIIRDIVESTGFFYDYEISVACELIEEYLSKGEESGYKFVFAEKNGETVAYTCYGLIACTKSSYDLFWIATHETSRGKGIGKLLLLETEKKIKELGGTNIYIETSSRDKYIPTQSFYTNNEYILEGRLKDFYDKEDDKLIFVKFL